MQLAQFDFALPPELIAETPLLERSASRLLQYDRKSGEIRHGHFSDLLGLFGADDVLVLNQSRVLRARIPLERSAEILLAEPMRPEGKDSELSRLNRWKCLVRKGKLFPIGKEIAFANGTIATVRAIDVDGLREIEFQTPDFDEFLERYGEIPLPPYIHEKLTDVERYQTVYSAESGSVAAPTAGLHFTPELLVALKEKGVQIEFITLHVGLGTFLPVKVEEIEAHKMHTEFYRIAPDVAERLNAAKTAGKRMTAVGTTSLRTLEAASGVQIEHETALQVRVRFGEGKTALFLYPPARFRFVDQLLTNFHLPKSTLLMLIAAFLAPGETRGVQKVQELYAEAIRARYRFFSFGDAMLIR